MAEPQRERSAEKLQHRGRLSTVQKYLGVILVPTLMTFLCLTIFGNRALFLEHVGSGAVTAVVLLGGELHAVRAASISSGLPFAVVLLLCVSIHRGLWTDWMKQSSSDAIRS